MTFRVFAKRAAQAMALAFTFPAALVCGWGRVRPFYTLFAHSFASVPGFPGNFLRSAYYRQTLDGCSLDTNIAFGAFFSDPYSHVESYVSIGSYCVIGRARIGERTQIASLVQITSGRHQHARDAEGQLAETSREQVRVGAGCWIGASAIVMADVGDGSTIGAGAVVVKDIPAGVVAVGNPAKVIRQAGPSTSSTDRDPSS